MQDKTRGYKPPTSEEITENYKNFHSRLTADVKNGKLYDDPEFGSAMEKIPINFISLKGQFEILTSEEKGNPILHILDKHTGSCVSISVSSLPDLYTLSKNVYSLNTLDIKHSQFDVAETINKNVLYKRTTIGLGITSAILATILAFRKNKN